MSNVTVSVLDKVGEVDIICIPDRRTGRFELRLDAEDEPASCLQVRVTDPGGAVLVERLVRRLPGGIDFAVPQPGRYVVEVRPLTGRGFQRRKTLTWSDWDDCVTGSSRGRGVRPRATTSAAVLLVA